MAEQDTLRLLRECDAGVKLGAAAIAEVLEHVQSSRLHQRLAECKADHEKLENELEGLLARRRDGGKDPNPMAKGMSWIKTNMKLAMNESDQTIADLMTDGCNMGVKSLRKYLNQYPAADEKSKDIAKRLIGLEENLAADLKSYL